MGEKKRGYYMSDDMVIEIQLRLPIKSLLRFKCVCKTWHNRFRDPEFTNTHHRKLQMLDDHDVEFSDSKLLLTRFASNPDNPCSFLRIVVDENERRDETVVSTENIILPFRNGAQFRLTVMGSCNGVICLEHDPNDKSAYRNILWNLATREVRILPPSNVRRLDNLGSPRCSIVGFGYDSKRNDLKVARMLDYDPYNTPVHFYQVELYSLRNNSWKEISTKDAPNSVISSRDNVITDNYYHQSFWEIFSFDITNEVFIRTKFPRTPELAKENFGIHGWRLTYFDKKLGLVIYPREKEFFDIWVLNEVGNTESWVKRRRIDCLKSVPRFVGILKDRFMFVELDDSHIGVYDVERKAFKRFSYPNIMYAPFLLDYTGSIMSIDGAPEHEEGFVRAQL